MKTLINGLFFIFAISIIIFLFFNTELINAIWIGDTETISSFLKENIFFLLLFTLALMLIQNTLSIIPLFLVITVNNTLFGFHFGFMWSWVTSILASVLVFIGIRFGLKDRVRKKFNPSLLNKLEQKGLWYVFQVRIFPFVPSNIINVVSGISSIVFIQFLLGTAIGNAGYFLVLSLVQAGFLAGNWAQFFLVLIVLISIVSYYFIKRYYNKKRRNKLCSTIDHH
ncbi:MAG: VTT domain-containing protein [Bacillus sp. (in: Bacteria)]|nr:VTT domain-containing protein [Bacillus sp. (in: firmicutes)]